MKIVFPRRLLQLQEVTLPLCEIGPSGIMLSQVRKEYVKQRSIGKSVREACREVEKILGIKDVRTDAAGKSIVYFKEDATDDLLSKFIGMKIDRCPTCRQLLAHRGGAALPCHNPKCPENPKHIKEGRAPGFQNSMDTRLKMSAAHVGGAGRLGKVRPDNIPASSNRSAVDDRLYSKLGLPVPTDAAFNTAHVPRRISVDVSKSERRNARCEFCGKKEKLKWAGDAWLCRACDVDDLREGYKSMSLQAAWAVEHPGYEFRLVARTPEGRKEVQKHNSLPRARVAAKLYAKQTGETVEVYDHQGRKYYTFSGLRESYGRTPLEDALVKSFADAGVHVNHLYELGSEIASIDSLKFEIASSKRLYQGRTVPGSEVPVKLRNGKTIYLPFDQAQELAKLWNRDMRSLKKYVNSRW